MDDMVEGRKSPMPNPTTSTRLNTSRTTPNKMALHLMNSRSWS